MFTSDSEKKRLVEIHARRLKRLREEQAVSDFFVHPSVLVEIEEIEAKIRSLDPNAEILKQLPSDPKSKQKEEKKGKRNGDQNEEEGKEWGNKKLIERMIQSHQKHLNSLKEKQARLGAYHHFISKIKELEETIEELKGGLQEIK